MDEAERLDDLYRALGHYIVTFSTMIAAMRQIMEERLQRPDDDAELIQLALSGTFAQQITDSYFAVCDAAGHLDDVEREIGRRLRSLVGKRIEERNRIAHGDWVPGITHVTVAQECIPAFVLTTLRAASRPHSRGLQIVVASTLETWTATLRELTRWVVEFDQLALGVYPLAEPGSVRVRDVFVLEGSKQRRKLLRSGPRAAEFGFE